MFEACRLYEEAAEKDCECDKANPAGYCPYCNRMDKARNLWGWFAERNAKLNPDWTELLELELRNAELHRNAWLFAYSALISIIEQRPGWDTCKPEWSHDELTLKFPGMLQMIGFVKSFNQMERRLHYLEGLKNPSPSIQAPRQNATKGTPDP